MNRSRLSGVFACLAASLLLLTPVSAQQVFGSVSGYVTDDSGAALPGVSVTVTNDDTGATRQAVTNAAGFYNAEALQAGNYTVTTTLDGFQTVRRENVIVQVAQDVTINVSMSVGSVEDAITVTAESPLIEVSRSSAASYVSEKEIEALPIAGRDFTDFALLTPTVQRDPVRGFLTMAGQRGIYTGLNIDGTDNKSAFFGYGLGGEATENDGLVVAQDSVKEFQVITNGFAPEYGAHGGGYINVITRSGTNEMQGSAFYYFTDDSMTEDLPSSPLDDFRGIDGRRDPDEFERTNFGASLGGAFVQDKSHYFVSIDKSDRDSPFTRSIRTPGVYDAIIAQDAVIPGLAELVSDYTRNADGSATGLFNRNVDNQIIFFKVDQQFNESNTGTFRINDTDYERTSSFKDEESLKTEETRSLVASLVSVIGGDKVNELRIQSKTDDLDRQSLRVGGQIEAQVQFRFGNFDSVGKFDFLPIIAEEEGVQFQDSFSYLFGNHDLKFGVDYQKDDLAQVFKGSADGRYRFNSLEDFFANDPSSVRIYFGNVSFPNYDESQALTSIYAQDSWRPNDKLTLNYGFRFSQTDNPDGLTHVFDIGRNIPDDDNNFAPRVGFAYAIGDEGTQVLRGGIGLFHGRTPTLIFASQVQENGLFPNFGRVTIGPGDIGYVPLGQPINNQNPPPDTIPSTSYLEPGFEDPETTRINLGYERELGNSGWSAGIDTVWAEGDKLQSNVDLNKEFIGYDEFGRPQFSFSRPNPNFNQIFIRRSVGESEYQAVTLKVNRRFRGRYQMQAHYTWSEDESNDDNERSATSVTLSDPSNPDYDFGLSDRDVTDRLVVSGLVELPWKLRLSGSAEYRSGTPWTATDQDVDFVYCGSGFGNCPDARAVINGQRVARNSFRNESIQRIDLRLARTFTIGGVDLDLFYEAFNLLDDNSFQVTGGENDPADADFGIADSLVTQPRTFQWGVRVRY